MRLISAVLLSVLLSAPLMAQSHTEQAEFLIARLAADEGDYSDALSRLDRVIEKEPSNPVLLFERARVLVDASKLDRAETELRKLVNLYPDFYDARRLLGRLLLDRSRGNAPKVEEALTHLQAAFRIFPGDFATGMTVSQILVSFERYPEAEKVLAILVESFPDNRMVNLQYAGLLTKLGRGDESRKYLERVIAAEPNHIPAAMQLIDIYQKSNEWKLAADLLSPLIEQEPLNIDFQRQQGYLLLRAGDSAAAKERFEEILKADPKDRRIQFLLGEALSDLGDLPAGEAIYRRLLEQDANDVDVMLSLGLNLLQQRKLEDGMKVFETIVGRENVPPGIRNIAEAQIAAVEHNRGNYGVALKRALEIIARPSEMPNSQAINIALDVYRRNKNWSAATELLTNLYKQYPADPFIGARLVEFLVRGEQQARAKSIAAGLVKGGRRGANAVADAYLQLENYPEAITILEQLHKETPEDIDVLFQLGAAYERNKNVERAEATFNEVLAARPDHTPTLNYLGYMWADRGVNLERAEEMLVRAVREEPRNGAYLDSLGWVYYKLGKLDLAEKYIAEAAALVPRDSTVQDHFGDILAKRGKAEQALEKYRAALELDPSAEEVAVIKAKIGQLEQRVLESKK